MEDKGDVLADVIELPEAVVMASRITDALREKKIASAVRGAFAPPRALCRERLPSGHPVRGPRPPSEESARDDEVGAADAPQQGRRRALYQMRDADRENAVPERRVVLLLELPDLAG